MTAPIQLVNIGYGNSVSSARIIAIVNPESAPIKRLIADAREGGFLLDATCGRRTRAVIVMDNNRIVLSSVQPDTISNRINELFQRSNTKTITAGE